MSHTPELISHSQTPEALQQIIQALKERITAEGDKPYVTIEKQLQLIDQLAEFEFGQFLLQHRGANGFWTDYFVRHPLLRTAPGFNRFGDKLPELEQFILEKAPVVIASQQRFQHFQRIIQDALHSDMTLTSIPCGLMNDLSTLNFSAVENIRLIGIDLDEQSLLLAEDLSEDLPAHVQTEFRQCDAWNLPTENEFDLLTSNGLSLYVAEEEKLLQLYQQFYRALKPNGLLVTSFITPIEAWDKNKFHPADLLLQKIILTDIGQGQWQYFRDKNTISKLLATAGFSDIEFIDDTAKIFLTVTARKK